MIANTKDLMSLITGLFSLLVLLIWASIAACLGIRLARFIAPHTRKFAFYHGALLLPGVLLSLYFLIIVACL